MQCSLPLTPPPAPSPSQPARSTPRSGRLPPTARSAPTRQLGVRLAVHPAPVPFPPQEPVAQTDDHVHRRERRPGRCHGWDRHHYSRLIQEPCLDVDTIVPSQQLNSTAGYIHRRCERHRAIADDDDGTGEKEPDNEHFDKQNDCSVLHDASTLDSQRYYSTSSPSCSPAGCFTLGACLNVPCSGGILISAPASNSATDKIWILGKSRPQPGEW